MTAYKIFWELCSTLEVLLELDRKILKESEEEDDFALVNNILVELYLRKLRLKQFIKEYNEILKGKPGIDVNVAGLAKFVVDCPHAGEFMCKLRDFIFKQDKDKEKI